MARPREFDTDKVVEDFMNVFWRYGFEATSLSDLMAVTGLQKGSLYAAFGDKRAMFMHALTAYDAEYVDGAIALMAQSSGCVALEAFLCLPVQSVYAQDRRGCFLCNAMMEAEALDDDARAFVRSSREKLGGAIGKALLDVFADQAEADEIAAQTDQIIALYFGMRTLARGGVAADRIQQAADSALIPFQERAAFGAPA